VPEARGRMRAFKTLAQIALVLYRKSKMLPGLVKDKKKLFRTLVDFSRAIKKVDAALWGLYRQV